MSNVYYIYKGIYTLCSIHNNKYAFSPISSGPPRNINNPCTAPICAGEWWFTNTTRVHALILPSKH